MPATKTPRRREQPGIRGRLKAHDPFELIRWLALSQTDPRKALAELVQNSLDAQAGTIRISRYRAKGVGHLRIFDDGEGVIPEMDRTEALRYIATHIGHSRKRQLSPQERFQLLTQGQYGIGLLGFWSLGEMLDMRSAVPGQKPYRLVLLRDQPTYRIEPIPGRLALDERWTEIVISNVHPDAQRMLVGRRAAEYLAAELRGQLLARGPQVVIEDRISRGRGQKRIVVKPPQFLGERIAGLDSVDVPGFPSIRMEVYWSGEGAGPDSGAIRVYAAGTQAAEDFRTLASLGLDGPPWTDARLSGFVDFPALRIAPGSRRGVVVDEAAEAFAHALGTVAPVLEEALEKFEERRAAELEKGMIRDLQRAFRDFHRHRPSYSMLPVSQEKDLGAGGGTGDAAGGASAEAVADGVEGDGAGADGELVLLPPGPLAEVRVRPAKVRVPPGETRRLQATAVDATGRPVDEDVRFEWTAEGGVGAFVEVESVGAMAKAALEASPDCREGWLRVEAAAASGSAVAEVPVEVTEDLPGGSKEGIPDPELVDAPGESWRSRIVEGRWQVNSGHRDFRDVDARPALKLRYLAMLFAKEIVVNDSADPRLAAPLEKLVEISAYADRKLAPGRGRKSGGAPRRVEEGE
jgi:hypothetical protein